MDEIQFSCVRCGSLISEGDVRWVCACGGLLDLPEPPPFSVSDIDESESGVWRYAPALPSVASAERIRLGEQRTPLIWHPAIAAWLKLDYLLPTGSYKDRGASVMVSKLRALGVRSVLDDSSGNAGASLAAYAAAAGLRCVVVVPASNSPGKLAQIRAYGAELRPVAGDRESAVAAALESARGDLFYASHNWHPAFILGVATLGLELFEQFGGRAPHSVIVPAGHGSIVLGLWFAFRALLAGGAVRQLPRIFAIQSNSRAALARAWAGDLEDVAAHDAGSTIAEGIAAVRPLRGARLLAALRETRGAAIAVGEAEIRDAWTDLGRSGFYVEPTSAVAVAGLARLRRDGHVGAEDETVLVLTGSGLKTSAAA